ncbi:uncharacterized protein LOC125669774 [Ostrea edulis]|uniref:uncharacterized protein LOC125669774 n=1 Tax=Ostrea edulis TaxID=37623 RepID=UPI002094D3DA|nr:uncharacterized protein LOC125669774 [Ostrea edulis]XP_048760493.1 uncharacterized protein LOC125669774 [Ostrea edulis]
MTTFHFHLNTTDPELLRKLNNSLIIEIKGEPVAFKDSNLNELLYVVVVIMFYGTALMVLIGTQIRKQRREGQEVDYYDEYLERNNEDSKKTLLPKIDVKLSVPLEADEIKTLLPKTDVKLSVPLEADEIKTLLPKTDVKLSVPSEADEFKTETGKPSQNLRKI